MMLNSTWLRVRGQLRRSVSLTCLPIVRVAMAITIMAGPGLAGQVAGVLQPHDLMRALMSLQQGMLVGRSRAISVHASLLQESARNMISAERSVWQDDRNVRAALLLVLNGGDVQVLKPLLELAENTEADARLLDIVRSFAVGQFDRVRLQIDEVDLMSVPPSLGAVLAMAGARAWQSKEVKKANHYYDIAGLLGSGALVEEAALRSQIALVAKQGDKSKSEALMRHYLQRMAKSVFAEMAADQIVEAVVALDYQQSLQRLSEVFKIVDDAPGEIAAKIYRNLTRAAVSAKQYDVARMSLDRLSAMADIHADRDASLRLLGLVADLHNLDPAVLNAGLAKVKPDELSGEDRQLHEAMQKIAGSIASWPEPVATGNLRRPSRYRPTNRLPRPLSSNHPDLDEVALHALKVLGRVEKLERRL